MTAQAPVRRITARELPDGRVGGSPYWMAATIARWAPDGVVPRLPRADKGVPRGPSAVAD